MINQIKIIAYCFFLLFLSCRSNSQELNVEALRPLVDLSKVEKYRESKELGRIISDFDSIFQYQERRELGDLLRNYDDHTTRQIVIVTIDSLKPYTDIQKFATDLANYWGVGDKEKNNGLTIVLCKPERKIGIATGLGTEKALTDSICKAVIDNTMIPKFKEGDFYEGIKSGVVGLIQKWD